MLFFPFTTDAPIYHLPFATVGIILANIIVFFLTTFQLLIGNLEAESIEWLILEFNQINPLQWITGAFMHGGLMHLLGNMFFLWAFGLVIEGKIGSIRFLVLYFAIALIDGALVQIPMYFISGESGALGASGVVFALMMIAVIWAPENEMDCFYWILVVIGTVEVRIISLGVAFTFLQIVFLYFGGLEMSSEMLHMIGAFIGAPIGFLMLRQGWVDCEGWDVVSRSFLKDVPLFSSDKQRRGRTGKSNEIADPIAAALGGSDDALPTTSVGVAPTPVSTIRKSPLSKLLPKPSIDASGSAPARSHPELNRLSFVFRQSLDSGSLIAATDTFHQLERLGLTSSLSDKLLFQYAVQLGKAKKTMEVLRPLSLVAERNGKLADHARLRLALTQIRVLKNPLLALRTLHEIGDQGSNDEEESRGARKALVENRDRLIAEASAMEQGQG